MVEEEFGQLEKSVSCTIYIKKQVEVTGVGNHQVIHLLSGVSRIGVMLVKEMLKNPDHSEVDTYLKK